jgi:hypothetical protein
MALAIKYTVPHGHFHVADEVEWCNQQGWRHLNDWRWFHHYSRSLTGPDAVQFHFEDDRHAHWFLLKWGGEVIGHV